MPKAKKLPSGTWRVLVYLGVVDGKKKYKSITAPTKKEAERKAAVYEIKKNAPVTFGKAFENFIESRKNTLSPNTVRLYLSIFDNYLHPFANLPFSAIDLLSLQRFVNQFTEDHSPKTAYNVWCVITAVFRQNEIEPPKIVLPKKQKNEISIPSDSEIQRMISGCTDEDLKTAVLLGAFCGLRRSEITALDNVDLQTDTITINKANALTPDHDLIVKSPKSLAGFRTIKIPHDIALRVSDSVSRCGRAVPISPDLITGRFRRLLKKLGLPHYRFHDLRHYCASSMIAQGIPDFYIVRFLGHESDNMLKKVYGHIQKDKADQFADRMRDVYSSFNF